jgi:hypothetical protein
LPRGSAMKRSGRLPANDVGNLARHR